MEIICFFLLGIAALLLNAGLSSQALPLFWLVLPLLFKISLESIPRRAAKNNIEGDVFIQFEITKSGYFINFTTIGPNKILEDEAYRIMSRLPQVQPGEYLGKKVSVLYGLPISFRLN